MRILLPLMTIFLIAAVSCQITGDYPPEPGTPGTVSPFGKATGVFTGYSEPTSFFVTPEEITFTVGDISKDVTAAVEGEQYVYRYGYVLDVPTNSWKQFKFDQSPVGLSNWIRGNAKTLLSITLDELSINVDETRDLYAIAYACTKKDNVWDCHENKWMIRNFIARLTEELPPEPFAPAPLTPPQAGFSSCDDVEKEMTAEGIDGVCIESDLEQFLNEVKPVISSGDVQFLPGGDYVESEGNSMNSVSYTEDIQPGFFRVTTQNNQDILLVGSSENVFTYNLKFSSGVVYDPAATSNDLKGSQLTLLGEPYIITDAANGPGGLKDMKLVDGQPVWLTQNNPITKTINGVEHTIEVLDATENEDACQVRVDDQTAIIGLGDTIIVNGVNTNVLGARNIAAELGNVDACQLVLGANEIEINYDQNIINVNGVTLQGASGALTGISGSWTGIIIFRSFDAEHTLTLSPGYGTFIPDLFSQLSGPSSLYVFFLGKSQEGKYMTVIFKQPQQVQPVQAQLPDLTIERVNFVVNNASVSQPYNAFSGDRIKFVVDVLNNGNTEVGNFELYWDVANVNTGAKLFSDTTAIPSFLGPGATATFEIPSDQGEGVTSGTYQAIISVDPSNLVAESREDNNVVAVNFIVGPACTPNWQCTGFSACSQPGFQSRTCTDTNNCGTNEGRPVEQQPCCIETDTPGNPDPDQQGQTCIGGACNGDVCLDGQNLQEYYCESLYSPNVARITCNAPFSQCSNGACS